MTFDFSHIEALRVQLETRVFRFSSIPNCELLVLPATEENRAFYTEQLAYQRAAAAVSSKKAPSVVKAARQRDRELYQDHIIRGWTFVDGKGQDVPYVPEHVRDFLERIPGWCFDELRVFCQSPTNFGIDDASEPSEEVLGNS